MSAKKRAKFATPEVRYSYILSLPLHTKIREMKKICYFISAAILLSFMGCGHQPMTKKLADIDSLIIKERYDSACAILNSLNKRQ